jgi:hypothetical protein
LAVMQVALALMELSMTSSKAMTSLRPSICKRAAAAAAAASVSTQAAVSTAKRCQHTAQHLSCAHGPIAWQRPQHTGIHRDAQGWLTSWCMMTGFGGMLTSCTCRVTACWVSLVRTAADSDPSAGTCRKAIPYTCAEG